MLKKALYVAVRALFPHALDRTESARIVGSLERKYPLEDTVLEELEKAARAGRKGLWADPQPVLPWEWRKR